MPDKLDILLHRRREPAASPDLSERIIASALRRRRPERWTFTRFRDGFFDLFLLPQPAFALGIVLLAGISLGLNGQGLSWFAETPNEILSSFSIAADSLDDEVFL